VRHNHADMNIGPKNKAIGGLDEIDMFRLFDPTTTDMTFWGQEFNIQAIVNEVQTLLPKLEKEANKLYWDTSVEVNDTAPGAATAGIVPPPCGCKSRQQPTLGEKNPA